MNKILMLLLLISIASCGDNSRDSDDESRQDGVNGQGLQEKLNSYTVNTSQRESLIEQHKELKKTLEELEQKILVEAEEDRGSHPEYQNTKEKGIIRLFNQHTLWTWNLHGGVYYSFGLTTHEFGRGNDIRLSNGNFEVGFAGADYGFFTILVGADLEDVSFFDRSLKYMREHVPPVNTRVHHNYSRDGVEVGGFKYTNKVKALNGYTYALRSVSYGNYDVLVAFQVIRKDPIDGSLILKWKMLKRFTKPIFSSN